jgi:hypothetical protein
MSFAVVVRDTYCMKNVTAPLLIALSLASACKKSNQTDPTASKTPSSKPSIDAAAPPAVDAAAPGIDAADLTAADPLAADAAKEAAARAGKTTGLGGPTEAVAVVTEDLIAAAAGTSFDVARLIDPAIGVFVIVHVPGATDKLVPRRAERLCGAKAKAVVAKTMSVLIARDKAGTADDVNQLGCSNEFVIDADPNFGVIDSGDPKVDRKGAAVRYATCWSVGQMEYDTNSQLYFLPAVDGSLHLAGIVETEVGSSQDQIDLAQLADEMARTGKLCK